MNLTLITQPSTTPITLADVEGQVRLNLSSETSVVELIIEAVRERAEAVTRRALVTQTWELTLDSFPSGRDAIMLPKPPLQSVVSIKYIDTNGDEQTLDALSYRIITSEPGYVLPLYGLNWPVTLNDVAVVTVRFTCGYGPVNPATELNIPSGIKQWMLLNCANLFENRESLVIGKMNDSILDMTATLADGLIENYRMSRL